MLTRKEEFNKGLSEKISSSIILFSSITFNEKLKTQIEEKIVIMSVKNPEKFLFLIKDVKIVPKIRAKNEI